MLADDSHTHTKHAVPDPVTSETVVAQGGNNARVPFIHSPAMDNQVAIRARHDLNLATYRVAMPASLPSFIDVG